MKKSSNSNSNSNQNRIPCSLKLCSKGSSKLLLYLQKSNETLLTLQSFLEHLCSKLQVRPIVGPRAGLWLPGSGPEQVGRHLAAAVRGQRDSAELPGALRGHLRRRHPRLRPRNRQRAGAEPGGEGKGGVLGAHAARRRHPKLANLELRCFYLRRSSARRSSSSNRIRSSFAKSSVPLCSFTEWLTSWSAFRTRRISWRFPILVALQCSLLPEEGRKHELQSVRFGHGDRGANSGLSEEVRHSDSEWEPAVDPNPTGKRLLTIYNSWAWFLVIDIVLNE